MDPVGPVIGVVGESAGEGVLPVHNPPKISEDTKNRRDISPHRSLAKRFQSITEWPWNSVPDNRFDSLVAERLDDRPLGYPRLAALENSDSSFGIYRRFGYLHNRLLLHRQAEIVALEEELDKLDDTDDQNPDCFRLTSIEFREGDSTEQKDLLDNLETKLKSYDNLLLLELKLRSVNKPSDRDYRSFFHYMYQRKPLVEGEDSFIHRYEDFISVADVEKGSWIDDSIASLLGSVHGKALQSLFTTSAERKKTSDSGLRYYSDSRLSIFIKMLIAFLAVALLMIPVWLLIFVHMSATLMWVTVLLFVCAFLGVLSLFTAVKRQDVFFGGVMYCAVLVVFLGSLSHTP